MRDWVPTNLHPTIPDILDNLLQIPVTATPYWTEAEKQPSGCTEPLLYAWRLKVKAA